MYVCFLQETKLEEVLGDLIRRFWGVNNFDVRFAVAVGRSRELMVIRYCSGRLYGMVSGL